MQMELVCIDPVSHGEEERPGRSSSFLSLSFFLFHSHRPPYHTTRISIREFMFMSKCQHRNWVPTRSFYTDVISEQKIYRYTYFPRLLTAACRRPCSLSLSLLMQASMLSLPPSLSPSLSLSLSPHAVSPSPAAGILWLSPGITRSFRKEP